MITPSAIRPTSAACAGVPIPKPTATGTSDSALVAATRSASSVGQLVALAGGPHGRDDVDEAAGDGADPAQALGRGRRRDQRHQRQPGGGERLADLLRLAERQVGDDRPGGPGRDRAARRTPRRRRGRGPCSRRPSGRPAAARRPTGRSRAPLRRWRRASSAAVAAAWIVGPSASGSEKGTPSSIRSAPASA